MDEQARVRAFEAATAAIGRPVLVSTERLSGPPGGVLYRCVRQSRAADAAGPGDESGDDSGPAAGMPATAERTLAPGNTDVAGVLAELAAELFGEQDREAIGQAEQRLAGQARRGVAPIRFYGGPRDGEVMALACDQDGYPAERVTLGAAAPPPIARWAADVDPDTPMSFDYVSYARGVLDPDLGRWHYHHVSPS